MIDKEDALVVGRPLFLSTQKKTLVLFGRAFPKIFLLKQCLAKELKPELHWDPPNNEEGDHHSSALHDVAL